MFNAKEYLDALQPPTFVDPEGNTHVGTILSHDQWLPLQEAMRGASKEGVVWADVQRNIRLICDAFFPPPRFRRLRGKRSVSDWVAKLPPIGQMRAVWSFMDSQGKAQGMKLTPAPGMQRFLDETPLREISLTGGSSRGSMSDTPASSTSGEEAGLKLATG